MAHLIYPQKSDFDPKISNFYEGTQPEQPSVHYIIYSPWEQ